MSDETLRVTAFRVTYESKHQGGHKTLNAMAEIDVASSTGRRITLPLRIGSLEDLQSLDDFFGGELPTPQPKRRPEADTAEEVVPPDILAFSAQLAREAEEVERVQSNGVRVRVEPMEGESEADEANAGLRSW